VPTYVIDAPGGGGKIPVMPNYVISQAPGKVVLRNFEGFITTYTEPLDYNPHEIEWLDRQVPRRLEPGQEGVVGLLEGEQMTIEPVGFSEVHARGGAEHRLRADPSKWQPLGIGTETKPLLKGEPASPDNGGSS